jgi:hypothetical protein
MTKLKKINDALNPSKIVAKLEKELLAPQRVIFAREDSGNFQQVASSNFLLGGYKHLLPTIICHQIRH